MCSKGERGREIISVIEISRSKLKYEREVIKMKYTKSVETIYTTTDYDGFVFTDWNRNVSNARVVKMVESIKTTGWLPNPVMVNEKFEVIDGQSRVKALERLGMPVQFCIKKGIGRKECQMLNLFQKNWTTNDYIDSYIADGNDNYIWLKNMMIRYAELTSSIVQSIASVKGRNVTSLCGQRSEIIIKGDLSLTSEDRTKIENLLFYLSRFAETAKYLGGRKDTYYGALSFLYGLNSIDRERLVKCVNDARFEGVLVTSSTTEGWLNQFESLYNKSLAKKNRIDIIHEYKIA